LTNRERFVHIMRCEPVDRLPVIALEPYEEDAVKRWHGEGLPGDCDPAEFLGMSRLVHVPVNLGPIPPFPQDVISEDDESIVMRSSLGALVRHYKSNPSMFYGHIDHPVKTREDWEAYRERFRYDTPGRLAGGWATGDWSRFDACEDPVGLSIFPFFFRLGFYAMGMQRFLTAFYDMPDLIHDMFAHWGEFVLNVIRPVVETVRLDFATFGEDLAGKNGPLVSPRVYAEFWHPYQDPILRLLQKHNVPAICQWSSGRFHELLPDMLEHGFNCTWPLEVTAGMDAPDLRRRFGRRLLLAGNIRKEAVIAGPEAIDREIERLMPLIWEGGFLPALDDMGAPDMSFAHYRHLIHRLQDIRMD